MTTSNTITIVIGRRLDEPTSGSSVYLMSFLKLAKQSNLRIRVVAAPVRSFGTRPWMRLHADFIALIDNFVWDGSVRFGTIFLSTSLSLWARLIPRFWFTVKSYLSGNAGAKPLSQLGMELPEREKKGVQNAIRRERSDIVVTEYNSLGAVLEDIPARSKAIFLHDLFSLRAESFRASGLPPDHIDISLTDEAKRCRFADVLIHASANELHHLAEHLPRKQHYWMSPRFPDALIKSSTDEPARAVFIGVRHGGNSDALAYLLDTIWPKVRAQLPATELWVVGTVGQLVPKDIADGPLGIRVLGKIDDLAEIGGRQSIGLAPTTTASGVSIKVVEYMSLGMPALVLPGALTGYDHLLDDYVIKTETDDAFCSALIRLLKDEELRKRTAARAFEDVPNLLSNHELRRWLANDQTTKICTADRAEERTTKHPPIEGTDHRHELQA